MKRLLTEIAAERTRQVEVEGWSEEHDTEHASGEMALAAASYAIESQDIALFYAAKSKDCTVTASKKAVTAALWPWDKKWWKPSSKKRNLVKSMALLLAELERLDREEE